MPTMRDSRMPDDWIMSAVQGNPIQKVIDPATGKWDGNIRSCPVRLTYFNDSLHVAVTGKNDNGTDKTPGFETAMLFPWCANDQVNDILVPLIRDAERKAHPSFFDEQTGKSFGLHWPIRDQGDKRKYSGYTPGSFMATAKTQYKPQIVDPAMNPIVDPSLAYPGVWAIVVFNLFPYGGGQRPRPIKGVNLGLQLVMRIADDQKLIGGAVDPKKVMAGVRIDAKFDPGSAFSGSNPPPPANRAPPNAEDLA